MKRKNKFYLPFNNIVNKVRAISENLGKIIYYSPFKPFAIQTVRHSNRSPFKPHAEKVSPRFIGKLQIIAIA